MGSSNLVVVLLIIGVFLGCCLAGYVLMVLRATHAFIYKDTPGLQPGSVSPTISVIVAARNEEDNIEACIRSICQQNYNQDLWELILIDDRSQDHTREVAFRVLQDYPLVKARVLSATGEGKKSAIDQGVRQATGEWILQTDADCEVKKDWLLSMSRWMTPENGFISGPIELLPGKPWIERLQAIETLGLVTLGAGSLLAGFPNMANGANMAYRRALFICLGGFQHSIKVASGDDEFLLQAIEAEGTYRLAFAHTYEAVVSTSPLPDWASLRRQRLRWVSKARSYVNRRTNAIQAMSWLGFLSFPWWLALGFCYPWAWGIFGGMVVVKIMADHWLMKSGAKFLHRLPWLQWLWLLELVYVPYVLWIGVAGNLTTSYRWKDRVVS
ncbi:MAG: glycosyltransferase [Bacteroidia bacterium]|nr:glycosyltransferase [Bacteroidia bacterium]